MSHRCGGTAHGVRVGQDTESTSARRRGVSGTGQGDRRGVFDARRPRGGDGAKDGPSGLRDDAPGSGGLEIERVDVTVPDQISALRGRLTGRVFDLLFVVAGISLAAQDAVGADLDTRDFERMMDTNVLGVMRTVEALQDLVDPAGTIAVMSSGQGSVSGNTKGGFEVYRATKAALNQMFRSYAVRHADERRALLLVAPGWVKTDLGGPDAALEIGDSVPPLVDTVDAQHGTAGLQYLDRFGKTVAW